MNLVKNSPVFIKKRQLFSLKYENKVNNAQQNVMEIYGRGRSGFFLSEMFISGPNFSKGTEEMEYAEKCKDKKLNESTEILGPNITEYN